MIGPRPDAAPTLVLLHEGLGCVGLWGDFPDKLQAATGGGVFVYSRAGYGKSSPVALPRPLTYMHDEARETLPTLLDAIGFRRGLLIGHSDGASIAAIYAGSHQDHRVGGLVLIAPHFFTEDPGIAVDRRGEEGLRDRRPARAAVALARRRRQRLQGLERRLARSRFPQMGYHRIPRLYPRAGADRAGRGRPIRHGEADRGRRSEECYCPVEVALLPGARHSPQREAPEATLKAISEFVARALRANDWVKARVALQTKWPARGRP